MPVMEGDEEMKTWARVLLIRKARKERKYMCLQEGLINYSPGAKSNPLLVFLKFYWNIALSVCLHIVCGCLQSRAAESNGCLFV